MEENKSFDFSKLWEIIKRNLKWLIILPIVCLLLSVLFTAVAVHPKYQATSQVLINKSDKGDLTMAEKFQADSQIVATYTDIAKSPRVLSKVADEVGHGEDANSISEKVEISNEPNSQVLNFTATDENKKRAEKIADQSAEIFKKQIGSLAEKGDIEVLSKSADNVKSTSASMGKNATVGFIAGLILAVILICILEFLRNSKKHKTQRSETTHTQHTHQRRRPKREDLTQGDVDEYDRPDEGNHLR
ncbi:putative capsular polysaccharide synthesis enzyme Cap5A [Staphylococcus piscifermentans]|uniref:Polysaccharide chain length determinant N-terminal domain-containing protein n=1 Tax=Staphylococcus piscifermentans TaxID=70258 RepID=A0A239TKZ4_9STAP|nr:Wzz/FepE/Etk N-terminal domain-containing protein [Staphylococcus piscifermentans]RTX86171.1 hypothetical protein CD139_01855 [Staphylococcus piscifermentans]GEP84900.1 hypothetical protein SPI02_14850 [Staphylococcus piscifermentans]SNU98531.1 putative capsular polysaccharide synthesis enzyme Cap5A [Staphylococcus piscifermentans]